MNLIEFNCVDDVVDTLRQCSDWISNYVNKLETELKDKSSLNFILQSELLRLSSAPNQVSIDCAKDVAPQVDSIANRISENMKPHFNDPLISIGSSQMELTYSNKQKDKRTYYEEVVHFPAHGRQDQ